jgi:S1-C subfamily serine protease
MKRNWVWLLWAGAAAAFAADDPAALQARIDAARAKLDAAAKELAGLYQQDTFHVQVQRPGSQVSLGALLMPRGSGGVNVAGVTPDGPAERGGIAAGDVLVAIDGTPLDGAGGPSIVRLFDALAAVAPGDTVRIDYLRGGERMTTDVIADAPPQLPPPAFTAVSGAPATDVAYGGVTAAGAGVATMAFVGRPDGFSGRAMIAGLELFDLSAELGRYFGVDDGVLVLRAPTDSGLIAGDVLRSINGAAMTASAQCVEALARVAQEVSIEVLRDGAVQLVQYTPQPGAPALLPLPPPPPPTMSQ